MIGIYPRSTEMLGDRSASAEAELIYLSIWNMQCPDCAARLRTGLVQCDGVLLADIFYCQGIGVIVYAPSKTTPADLIEQIGRIGNDASHYFGAELIGRGRAANTLAESYPIRSRH